MVNVVISQHGVVMAILEITTLMIMIESRNKNSGNGEENLTVLYFLFIIL